MLRHFLCIYPDLFSGLVGASVASFPFVVAPPHHPWSTSTLLHPHGLSASPGPFDIFLAISVDFPWSVDLHVCVAGPHHWFRSSSSSSLGIPSAPSTSPLSTTIIGILRHFSHDLSGFISPRGLVRLRCRTSPPLCHSFHHLPQLSPALSSPMWTFLTWPEVTGLSWRFWWISTLLSWFDFASVGHHWTPGCSDWVGVIPLAFPWLCGCRGSTLFFSAWIFVFGGLGCFRSF